MTVEQVEALLRNIIAHRGLRFAILSVAASPVGWQVRLRGGAGGTVAFTLRAGRPLAMRTAILDELEAATQEGAAESC